MADQSGDFVALVPIFYRGSRAYNPGDRVPAVNVRRHEYRVGEQVAEYDSPEARAVLGLPEPAAPQPLTAPADKAPSKKTADRGTS
ncbi:hypothetical protein [Actinomadura opuntiae]|uniref:hypothetical protein n=1 Tax=Actinomadura sp. OS1-43 TaxID=604315 RepID=UPI00255AE635|nr:hypothetical protein [Actinomadura sp. OS1-43]MDL4812815.1 hypothetical protein [Actinomadura sp. OS1-43]